MEERLAELFPDQIVQIRDYHSFINQPERIQISSQEDINDYDPTTLTSYYNFRVRLPRPCLNVKSLQLARASIPNAVPMIPDTETTFWYYALPDVASGSIYEDNGGVPGDLAYTFTSMGVLKNPIGTIIRSGFIYANNNGSLGNILYEFDLNGNVLDNGNPVAGASINFTTGLVIIPPIAPITSSQSTYDTSLEYVNPHNGIPCKIGNEILYFILFDTNEVFFDSGNLIIGAFNYVFNTQTAKTGVATACISNGDTDYWIVYENISLGTQRINYLRYVRLLPSFCQPELMDNFTGGYNRTFTDYDDLVSELNNATTDDPLDGENDNTGVGIFKFVPNQISFGYNARFNKILFTGLDTDFSYLPVASDDPIWYEAAIELKQRDIANTRFAFSGAVAPITPYQPFRNLNLRLGFSYATYPQGDNFLNMLRPIPPYINEVGLQLGDFSAYDHVAPGYCDLVYSACCFIYCDITGGSTLDTIANKALLASVPLNTPNLGVGFHSLPLSNPLTKIVNQIYEVYIELRTDTGQPFYLPNNAIVSLELILTY